MPKRRSTHPRFDASDDLLGAPLGGRIDLHGMTADEAEAAVRSFIETSRRREPGMVVLIITGKGNVLKPAVRGLLKTKLSAFISEWALDGWRAAFMIMHG